MRTEENMHVAFVIMAEAAIFGTVFGLQRVSSVFYPIYMHEFNLTAQATSSIISPMYFVFWAIGLCCRDWLMCMRWCRSIEHVV